jgi:hypothetical protein
MTTHGGKREGSGGKLGQVRPKLTDYWSQDDIEEYFYWLKENYKKDTGLAKFVGEHIMGKAVQPIGNDDGKPLIVQFDSAFNGTTQ